MKAQGQLQPIVLRPSEASGYYLVAGMHRLAAAKTLQWESIWATVLEGLNADRAALAEIDENLARADLSPAERAAHQHARKELYERLHPQTRKGSAGGRAKSAKSQGAKYQVDTWHPAYIDDAAKKSGRSRASISREANRGKSIPDVADLAGTSLDKGTELDALGRLPSDVREQLAAEAKVQYAQLPPELQVPCNEDQTARKHLFFYGYLDLRARRGAAGRPRLPATGARARPQPGRVHARARHIQPGAGPVRPRRRDHPRDSTASEPPRTRPQAGSWSRRGTRSRSPRRAPVR